MKNITITLLVIVSVFSLIFTISSGIQRGEKVECYEWQRQSEQFVGFYLTEWQKSQCDFHDIVINAPVR